MLWTRAVAVPLARASVSGGFALRVLIVEDESDFARLLADSLERAGHRAVVLGTGEAALWEARAHPPDCILLDWMLPDLPGTEVLRRLKADSATRAIPVILVTARGEEVDRIVGLELGADDYMVKPVSLREVALRIAAVTRRRAHEVSDGASTVVEVGPLRLDGPSHRAFVAGVEVPLTALEFRVLSVLASRPGRVFTRAALLREAWDIHAEVETRTVDVTLKRVRDKLGAAACLIETVRGVGYRFADHKSSSHGGGEQR